MTIDNAIKALARRIDPVCWRSYSGKSRDFKGSMEARRVTSLRKAQAEADAVDGNFTVAEACETIFTEKAIRDRAYKIDPACWTSYSNDGRIQAQEVSLAEARRQLLSEWQVGGMAAIERTPPDGGSGVPRTMTASIGNTTAAEWERGCAARYTVDEIDRMRKAIARNPKYRVGSAFAYGEHYARDNGRHLEDVLRTHMLNGTAPADLEKAADDEWEAIKVRRALRAVEKERLTQGLAETEVSVDDAPVVYAERLTNGLPLDNRAIMNLRIRVEEAFKAIIRKAKGR